MSSRDEVYFANKEPKDKAGVLLGRSNDWFQSLEANGYLDKLRTMWAAYHGAYYSDSGDSHMITFGGEQGELTQIAINHLRNIAQHMLTMITSTRPTMQARSINTDYRSLVQTKLANGLLDYYMRDHRLEGYLKTACEYAIVFGSGYVKMEWNATRGEVYDIDDETGLEIKEGDVEFSNLSPFDVMMDSNVEDRNHDWVLTRSFKNRFDLAAKYPEFREGILSLPTKNELQVYSPTTSMYNETDLIPVYEFYHKRTEATPDGNYMLFVSDDIILLDSPMPYKNLPVYQIVPAFYLGTPYGYTPMFDILAPQDAINTLYSTVFTNQSTFGVQNLLVGRGSDINMSQLSSGLNVIEANLQAGGVTPLNLTNTPKEIFDFIQMLEKAIETVSSVNSVTRGNPDPNLRSANALALVQSMTLQFMSGLQQSYVSLIEDVGTGIVNILKDHAAVPRVATIVGKNNRSYLKEFTGKDLSDVSRVIVDIGNPLARCLEKGTEVLMYDGSIKKVEDIQINEKVMGPDSKARTVSNVNTGTEMMYKVVSKDKHRNISYGANESHILTLKYCSDDSRYDAKKGDILDISIRDYLQLSDRHKRLLQGFKVGVEFSEKKLDVPAYILGSWLGDGTSATTAITSMDAEIVNEWQNYADSIGMHLRISTSTSSGKAKTYHITSGQGSGKSDRNPFMNELRQMEVINNKHIPALYLKGSRNQRLDLLAGLIDTDGYRNGETFIFTQKNDRLTNDVVFLAESLGFRVTTKKVKSSSSDLVGEITGEINKVTIGGNTWEIPTRLPRKQAQPKSKARDWSNYGINVIPVGEGQFYGFTLKEEPHFVLGNFVVTHNTTAGRVEMAEQMLQMGVIKTPEQYFSVINTGQLDVMTEDTQSQLFLIKAENERLVNNEPVIAVWTDEHNLHIKEHASILADPELRFDVELVMRVTAHIQEHIELLKSTEPEKLQMIGQQPLSPNQAPPPQQQNIPDASMQGQVPSSIGGQPVATQLDQQGAAPDINVNMPQVDPNLLANPQIQEQLGPQTLKKPTDGQ
jgi:hypothetical protein